MKFLLLCLFTFVSLTLTAQQLTRQERKKITADLEKAFTLDQEVRKQFNQCMTEHSGISAACKELGKKLGAQDSANQQVVFPIIDQYGWIPVPLISKKANSAFFYVIQHAQLEAQIKYAPWVDTAWQRKEISPIEYAYFVDRLRSKQGKAQLYGSQAASDNLGNSYPYPIENWVLADSLRKQIGVPPLNEFFASSGFRYNHPPQTDFSKYCLLIGHIWEPGEKPLDSVNVSIAGEKIGMSDENGFFMITVEKEKIAGAKVTLEKTGFKTVNYGIKGKMDFYDIYAMLR